MAVKTKALCKKLTYCYYIRYIDVKTFLLIDYLKKNKNKMQI